MLRTARPRVLTLRLCARVKRWLGELNERQRPCRLFLFPVRWRRVTNGLLGRKHTLMRRAVHRQFARMPEAQLLLLAVRDVLHDRLTQAIRLQRPSRSRPNEPVPDEHHRNL